MSVHHNLNNVIHLNEKAIRFLTEGKHEEVAPTLDHAFSWMKSMVELQDGIGPGQSGQFLSENTPYPKAHQLVSSVQSIPILDEDTLLVSSQTTNNNIFTFFNRAFSLSTNEAGGFISQMNRNGMTSILLYNKALYHHNRGILYGNSKELEEALRLYSMSCTIIESSTDAIEIKDMNLFVLALWNNMGHIHSNFFNVRNTQVLMECMKGLIESMEDPSMVQEEFLIFYSNTFITSTDQALTIAPTA